MAGTITGVLNNLNEMGIFSYVIPFLLIFAVIYAILEKSKILGDNRGVGVIVSASIGLLALQFDFVSEFFSVIFPRFGIGISIFIVLIIMLGFFLPEGNPKGSEKWIGWVVGIGVAVWSLSAWDQWSGSSGFGGWFVENVWAIIVLAILITIMFVVARPKKSGEGSGGTTPSAE